MALLPQTTIRHLSMVHQVAHNIKEDQIQAIAKKWNLVNVMPNITGPIHKLGGLAVTSQCSKCPLCSISVILGCQASMSKHYSQSHHGVPHFKINTQPLINAQQLNKGQHKSFFEVIISPALAQPTATEATEPADDIINYLRISRNNVVPQYFFKALDARAISNWIKYTKWHLHIEPYNTNTLIALASSPSKDETQLLQLKDAVTSIYQTGYDCIDSTNIILLQKLKTGNLDGR